ECGAAAMTCARNCIEPPLPLARAAAVVAVVIDVGRFHAVRRAVPLASVATHTVADGPLPPPATILLVALKPTTTPGTGAPAAFSATTAGSGDTGVPARTVTSVGTLGEIVVNCATGPPGVVCTSTAAETLVSPLALKVTVAAPVGPPIPRPKNVAVPD